LLFPRVARLTDLHFFCGLLAGGLSLATVLAVPARAEDPPHRVGSLNYVSGEVNYALRAEGGGPGMLSWSTADFNQPVCQDMSLQTGTLARARIRIGPNAIQMSSDTLLDMLNLSDHLIEAGLAQGRIHLQLRDLGEGESVEIEIPRGSFWLLQSGAYDIETPGSSDQPARITVFEGKARFVGGAADVLIVAGEEIQVTGAYPAIVTTQRSASGANPTPANASPAPPPASTSTKAGPPPAAAGANPTRTDIRSGAPAQANSGPTDAQSAPSDDFLSWAATAETDATPPASPRHASVQMTGYEELDPYGRWQAHDDYGPVWFPTAVPADWAPYRFGHWASIPPWGWTWIDDQPWGFAPFHYGRWVYVDDRWGWAPGPPVDYPVYAPALVAFMETSEGAEGEPPVGWFPLAPGDAFIPWYAAGPDYVDGVNVVYWGRFHDAALRWRAEHGREIWRGELANRRFATFVSREAFAHGRAVEREMIRVPPERLERAMVMRGAPRIMPAVMRTMAGPGGLHAEPRGVAPGMSGPGGFHGEPHGPAPGMALDRGPRGEPRGVAATGRSNPGGFARPGAAAVAAQAGRVGQPMPQGYGRPEAFHTPAPTYRPGMYGQPQVARMPQMMGRGMPAMMGRMPQVAARPAVGGGGVALRKK
jgi:hypothetical protein